MLNVKNHFYCIAVLIILLESCSIGTGFSSYNNDSKISIEHVASTGDIHYETEITGDPVDIFFSFTNVNTYIGSDTPEVDSQYIVINGEKFEAPLPVDFAYGADQHDSVYSFIEESTKELVSSLKEVSREKNLIQSAAPPSYDYIGETSSNFKEYDGTLFSATCREVTSSVDTGKGPRVLNIWVADDCWTSGGTKSHLVDQSMVDALSGKFLQAGLDNDIYDWVTSIIGAEWGASGYSNLIGFNGEITILLRDIDDDDSDNGGIVGYFWSGNNFTDVAESNERIMFVIDAVMYANPSDDGSSTAATTGWSEDDFWARVVFSTLAHEFQHMINFYQKNIVEDSDKSTETWVNEMCSMLVEDFLSDKIGVEGPRGVSPLDPSAGSPENPEGRLPWFNQYLTRTVLVDYPQSFDLPDYAVSYAFGAWLARNYGGVNFLHNVVDSPYADKEAIEYAVKEYSGDGITFEELLQRWGGAIFLSDKTAAPSSYQYNCGDWFVSSINGNTFNLGSINLYNYSPEPEIALSPAQLSSGLGSPGTNVYLLAEENAVGKFSWDITIPEDVRLSVIFKKN